MLTHIYIENFAIIEKLALDVHAGMTVVTGETGAGKSIILDALELVLGARADSAVVRPGTERCDIIATFDIQNNLAAKAWLNQQALENYQECFLKRTIQRDGRSRCFINGQPVPLQSLRLFGGFLINVHGQHEHQALLQRDAQRDLLDAYAELSALLTDLKALFQQQRTIHTDIQTRQHQLGERESRLSFLQYQVQELQALALTPERLAQLDQEHKQLAHAEQYAQAYQQLIDLLESDDNSILRRLNQACHLIQSLPIKNTAELLNNALIQLQEATDDLQRQLDHNDIHPERLQAIEQELTKIYDLSRKHRIKPEALPALASKLETELTALENIDAQLADLQAALELIMVNYQKIAKTLSKKRQEASKKMSIDITQHMQTLGMPGGQFSIALTPYPEQHFSSYGVEKIEFLVSVNPGQPLQPLAKVASGGELSRIGLAIQLIAAKHQSLPTLIFDEVDVGIGGSTAAMVGQLLRQLAAHTQIICITHLPQVASQGHHHWQVKKNVSNNQTYTQVNCLTAEARIQEIARMLGGLKITKQTLAHAREMVLCE